MSLAASTSDRRLSSALCFVYILAFLCYPLLPAERSSTEWFLWWSSGHSLLGLALAWRFRTSNIPVWLQAALFLLPRIVVFPMLPWLSDDVYRYLWDGRLLVNSYNPYAHLPQAPELGHLRGSLYDLVDYTHISTLYPPLAQYLFGIATVAGSLFSDSWYGGYVVWKLFLFAAETTGLLFVRRSLHLLGLPQSRLALYLFLPLPVIECLGQAHIDGLLVAPIGALLYTGVLLYRSAAMPAVRTRLSIAAGALAGLLLMVKVIPVAAALPFLRMRLRHVVFLSMAAAVVIIPSLPLFVHPEALTQFLSVVRFYSHTAQFNGVPLYALLHLLEFSGVDRWWLVAPPLLSLIRAVATASCLLIRPDTPVRLVHAMLAALLAVTLLSGKVHIWYYVPLLVLNIAAGWWSLPVFASASLLTYAIYAGPEWKEAYTVEYVVWAGGAALAVAEWLWRRRRHD